MHSISSIYPKSMGGRGGKPQYYIVLIILPKIDVVQLYSMAPEVTEHHSFLTFQLAVTFPYSHLLSCVYFIFMHMTAELLNQPVQSCNYCFQKNAHDNYYINNWIIPSSHLILMSCVHNLKRTQRRAARMLQGLKIWPSGKNEKGDLFDLGNRRLGENLEA